MLNATQDDAAPAPIAGVPGLADEVAKEVVKPAGFASRREGGRATGFARS